MHPAAPDPATVSIDRVTRPAPARALARARTGRTRLLAALTGAALLAGGLAAPAGAHDPRRVEAEAEPTPLAVSIETLTPSAVPSRGRITVTGQIHNRSESTWTDLNVYLFASSSPITSAAELAEANASGETTEVGQRITTQGRYDEVPDLEPGEQTSYRLDVPVSELPFGGPGVYWLGVHVLGSNEEGRDTGADGRARTFVPLMAGDTPAATLSLVMPVRYPVRRTTEGRLAAVDGWVRRLETGGRLDSVVDLADDADVPLTWVVDAAVLEAVRSLAVGNPSFDLSPTAGVGSGESPGSEAPVTESPSPEEDLSEELDELTEEAATAESWLESFTEVTADDDVRLVPYGDVDVAKLLRSGFGNTLRTAERFAAGTASELGLDASPVIAPLDGLLPRPAVRRLGADTPILLSERAVDLPPGTVRLSSGAEAVVYSEVARTGGPLPTAPRDALALRQRILAEAAVHGLEQGPDRPLVVPLPERWDPGTTWRSADFLGGLDVPWLRTVDLGFATAISRADTYDAAPAYTRKDRRRELPFGNLVATQDLHRAGRTLDGLLSRNETVAEEIGRAAMLGSSVHARSRPRRMENRTRRIAAEVHDRLQSVYIESSPLITMSSESGTVLVTLVNDLDEQVTVGIDVKTGSEDLTFRDHDPVSLGPGQRASVRLPVTSTGTGVYSVRFVPTTEDGRPLGRVTDIRVRSSQVGLVIWVIMGTGALVFVTALTLRIVRRVRQRKRDDRPLTEDPTP